MRTLRFGILICLCFAVLFTSSITPAQAKKSRYYFEERGEVVWEVPTDQKVIALTFDDGPNPKFTPQVLDILKQYKAKATFFVIGSRVQQYPELAKREVEEGHEVANHTFSHPLKQLSTQHLREEITTSQEAILQATGQAPCLFRPPGGVYNEGIVRASQEVGCRVILWTWRQDTKDWSMPGADKIARQVIDNAHNGDIVLLHDHGRDRNQTIQALQKILPELLEQGYRFVTVSEMLKLDMRPKKVAH